MPEEIRITTKVKEEMPITTKARRPAKKPAKPTRSRAEVVKSKFIERKEPKVESIESTSNIAVELQPIPAMSTPAAEILPYTPPSEIKPPAADDSGKPPVSEKVKVDALELVLSTAGVIAAELTKVPELAFSQKELEQLSAACALVLPEVSPTTGAAMVITGIAAEKVFIYVNAMAKRKKDKAAVNALTIEAVESEKKPVDDKVVAS